MGLKEQLPLELSTDWQYHYGNPHVMSFAPGVVHVSCEAYRPIESDHYDTVYEWYLNYADSPTHHLTLANSRSAFVGMTEDPNHEVRNGKLAVANDGTFMWVWQERSYPAGEWHVYVAGSYFIEDLGGGLQWWGNIYKTQVDSAVQNAINPDIINVENDTPDTGAVSPQERFVISYVDYSEKETFSGHVQLAAMEPNHRPDPPNPLFLAREQLAASSFGVDSISYMPYPRLANYISMPTSEGQARIHSSYYILAYALYTTSTINVKIRKLKIPGGQIGHIDHDSDDWYIAQPGNTDYSTLFGYGWLSNNISIGCDRHDLYQIYHTVRDKDSFHIMKYENQTSRAWGRQITPTNEYDSNTPYSQYHGFANVYNYVDLPGNMGDDVGGYYDYDRSLFTYLRDSDNDGIVEQMADYKPVYLDISAAKRGHSPDNQTIPENPDLRDVKIFPDPFNSQSSLQYTLTQSANVEIAIYDILGQKVATIERRFRSSGTYRQRIKGDLLGSSGVYFVAIKAGQKVKMKKIVYLK